MAALRAAGDPRSALLVRSASAPSHVTFAVCSANGRVLAAIDLDTDRGNSRRVMQIKAVGAERLSRALPALPGRPSAVGRRIAAARAEQRLASPRPATAPNLHQARDICPAPLPRGAPNALRCGKTRPYSRTRSSPLTTGSTASQQRVRVADRGHSAEEWPVAQQLRQQRWR